MTGAMIALVQVAGSYAEYIPFTLPRLPLDHILEHLAFVVNGTASQMKEMSTLTRKGRICYNSTSGG